MLHCTPVSRSRVSCQSKYQYHLNISRDDLSLSSIQTGTVESDPDKLVRLALR